METLRKIVAGAMLYGALSVGEVQAQNLELDTLIANTVQVDSVPAAESADPEPPKKNRIRLCIPLQMVIAQLLGQTLGETFHAE